MNIEIRKPKSIPISQLKRGDVCEYGDKWSEDKEYWLICDKVNEVDHIRVINIESGAMFRVHKDALVQQLPNAVFVPRSQTTKN